MHNTRNKYLKTGGKLINNKNKYNLKSLEIYVKFVMLIVEQKFIIYFKNSNINGIINNEFNKNHKQFNKYM